MIFKLWEKFSDSCLEVWKLMGRELLDMMNQ